MMEYGLIIGVLALYFGAVLCAFFSAQLAALKGRRRSWGILGVILGPIGLILVCFLPNKKGITGETNPIKAAFRKMSGVSPAAVWIVAVGVFVVAGGALLGSRISAHFENRGYEAELEQEEAQSYLSPEKVEGAIESMFCGSGKSLAVTEEGLLYGWGILNEEEEILFENAQKAMAAGDTLFVLDRKGNLYAKGDNAQKLIPGQSAKTVKEFVKIEGSVKDFSVAGNAGALIKTSGNLYTFGKNTYRQLGTDAAALTHLDHKVASDVKKVIVTKRSLYYLKDDGAVYGIGNNAYGQFGLGNKKTCKTAKQLAKGCIDIAAGEDFLLLLKKDGTLLSAGNNAFGQLGRMTAEEMKEKETVAEQQSANQKEDKKEEKYISQTKFGAVEGPEEIEKIAAGGYSAFALAEGKLYGWGDNRLGQLGLSGKKTYGAPKLSRKRVAEVAAGGAATLIETESGDLLGAGDRRYQQLGKASGKGFERVAAIKEAKD